MLRRFIVLAAVLVAVGSMAAPAFAFGGGGGRTRGETPSAALSDSSVVLVDDAKGGSGGTGGAGGAGGTGGENPLAHTPEPLTLLLVSSGLIGTAAWARRRRK
jgi:PEP-CTERM motif